MIQENFVELYENSFRDNWDRPALTDYFKRETFSYQRLSEEIAKLHLVFELFDVKKGDKIALVGRATPRWGTTFFAAITYGAVIVPILPDFNANDITHIVNHSDSVLLFSGEHFTEVLYPENMMDIRAIFSLTDFANEYVDDSYQRRYGAFDIEKAYKERYPAGLTPEQVKYHHTPNQEMVLLNYTSGTTGFSKGVMLSGNALMGNVQFAISLNIYGPESRALAFLPLAHAYGCTFDFLFPLATGSHVTMLGKIPAPRVLMAALAEVRPNMIFTVPLILEKIYKKQIVPVLEKQVTKMALKVPLLYGGIYMKIRKKLTDAFGGEFNHIIVGGAAMNPDVEQFFKTIKMPFTVGYGMTECGPLISYTAPSEFVEQSCGKPLEGIMTAKIEDPNPETGIGEICVKGENVMMGYYKNQEATKAVLDADGWLHTGDMGTLAEDGTIFIRGRSKTMILTAAGQNIYPEEIESKLNNMPCVMESLVVQRGNKLVALVYPDYDGLDDIGPRDGEVIMNIMRHNIAELNKIVAGYEQISDVILYPSEFEKTPKRSIKRYLYTL